MFLFVKIYNLGIEVTVFLNQNSAKHSSFRGRNVDTSHTASPCFVGCKGRIVREILRHRGLSCDSRAL